MKKIITIAILCILLTTSAIAAREGIKISTERNTNQILSFDGKQQETNIKINLNFKERCDNCKFNAILGEGRIRFYWFDYMRNSVELKKIKATNIDFGSEIIQIRGIVDTIILYNERDGRKILRNEPVEITLNKQTNELTLKVLGSTIDNIEVKWKD